MNGPIGGPGQPVRFNERTLSAVLSRVGFFAVVALAGSAAFTVGYGWLSLAPAFWLFLWLVGWLTQMAVTTEWTVTGNELSRRRWLSRPGSRPSIVAELGPSFEVVHERPSRWRLWPGGAAIDLQPWHSASLARAMQSSGVRVDDWHGAWVRRHRLLNGLGLVILYGGIVPMFVAFALAPMRPGDVVGYGAFAIALGLLMLGLAIDLLPYQRRPVVVVKGTWSPR